MSSVALPTTLAEAVVSGPLAGALTKLGSSVEVGALRAAVLLALSGALFGCGSSEEARARLAATSERTEPLVWVERDKLIAADGMPNDRFGFSVALSENAALVGAHNDDGGLGSAYLFARSGKYWSEQQKVSGSPTGSAFGRSVSVSGETALVGASGEAYVFVRAGGSWGEQDRFEKADSAFGASVSISGDIALVSGSPGASAYVFRRSGGTWSEEQTLTTPDGAVDPNGVSPSVAVSGETALIGTVGTSAHVFVRSGGSWIQQQSLTPSGSVTNNWGHSVALSGDTALLGVYSDGSYRGSAFVFTRNGVTWTQQQKLTPSDVVFPNDEINFGNAVALHDDTALVGARADANYLGAAYVFTRTGATWTVQQKLTGTGGGGELGRSVALVGESALLGAHRDDTYRGAALVFHFGKAVGDPCTTSEECANAECVDGRCCDSACTGACAACSVAEGAASNGVCTVFPAASPGSPSCGTLTCNGLAHDCVQCTSDSQCAAGRYCSAAGTCLPQRALGDSCNPSGGADCLQTGCRVCSTAFCDGTCTNCRSDEDDCPQAQYCAADGTCVSRKAPGAACSTAATTSCRVSGCRVCGVAAPHCVEGVCCDSPCDGECEACVERLTGTADGSCAPVPADQDPEDECPMDPGFPTSCGPDGSCDGARACRAAARAGTPCGATMCVGSTTSGSSCNGSGQCTMSPQSCAPYLCVGSACGTSCTSDSNCTSDGYCIQGGTCALKKGHGEACGAARECTSGFCADGRCCATPCDEECDTCSAANGATADGTCTPLPVGTGCSTNLFCTGSGLSCTGCATDAHCPADRYCTPRGTCMLRRQQREACDDSAGEDCREARCRVCESDHCVDGLCCDRACGSTEACAADLKVSGNDGTCGEATTAVNGAPCTTNETCTSGRCVDGVCCSRECTATEACTASLKVSGRDGTCSEAKTAVNGASCTTGDSCTSTHCADGVCCDEQCWGPCRACTLALRGAGEDGECGLVEAGTNPLDSSGDPERDRDPECLDEAACDTPSVCSEAGRCVCETAGLHCGDDGVTILSESETPIDDCTPYRCRAGACGTSCSSAADCAPGNRCTSDDRCVSSSPASSPDDDAGCGCRVRPEKSGRSAWLVALFGLCGFLRRRVRQKLTTAVRKASSQRGRSARLPSYGAATHVAALAFPFITLGCTGPTKDETGVAQLRHEASVALVWGRPTELPGTIAADAVAVALDGDTIAIGNGFGVVRVFVRSGPEWEEATPPAARSLMGFGRAIQVDGELLAVGSNAADNDGVYLYQRSASGWNELGTLSAECGMGSLSFLGWSLSLEDDMLLSGCSPPASAPESAHVFVRSGTSWLSDGVLSAPAQTSTAIYSFPVALSGTTALVGAPTSLRATFYIRAGMGSWTEQQTVSGPPVGWFGSSVALDGDTAVIGQCACLSGSSGQAAAYVYVRSGSTWTQQAMWTGNPGFGAAVALDGDTALVYEWPLSQGLEGTGHVLTRTGTTWSEQARLMAPGYANPQHVALEGATAVIGNRVFRFGLDHGAACDADEDCADGYCVDSVCCDQACDGPCGACSEAEGATADGACTILPAGSEGSPSCDTLACNGTSPECEPCATDSDCPETRYCAADETCQPRKPQGDACNDAAGEDCLEVDCRVCETDYCSDGVCCDAPCDGECEACTEAKKGSGEDGVCDFIAAGTDPEPECEDSPGCTTAPLCNGAGRCTCAAGGDVCADDGVTLVTADPDVDDTDCTPYACEGAECNEACDDGSQCAPGHRCTSERRCVPGDGASTADESAGCGCRAGRRPGGSAATMLLGLGLVLASWRRRCHATSTLR
jgi:MYXO-CTERM domain-containing protein